MKQISFTFGTTLDKDGMGILPNDRESAIRLIEKEAAQIFGGYTLYDARGGWINSAGRLAQEYSMTLMVLVDHATAQERESKIEELRQIIKTQLNQEAVAVCVIHCEFSIQ